MEKPTRPDTTGMWHQGANLAAGERDRWLSALRAFEVAQLANRCQPATITRRVKHVRRFALYFEGSPWHVRFEDYAGWLQSLEVSDATKASMRDSLRAFYRWAYESERVSSNPTAEPGYRATRLAIPDRWVQPLVEYERFLSSKGDAPQTIRARMEQLRTFARDNDWLAPFEVTTQDNREWQAAKVWAKETRRHRKVTLHGFFKWAVDEGMLDVDPTEKLPKVRTNEPTPRPAADQEYALALQRADERWALALRCAAELGLRREEVSRIHSADLIRRTDGTWLTVHGKGSKTRVLPVPPDLASVILRRPEGYLFPGRIVEKQRHKGSGHLSARYLGKQIGGLLPEGVTMHALRHRFATRAYHHNRDVFTLQKLLGHASAATTQRYVQVSDAHMRTLVEAMTDL